MNVRAAEQLVEVLHQRIDALCGQRAHDTGKGGKGMSSSAIFGAVRHLAGDDRRAQGPFGPIVRRLDPRVHQETQHVAPVVMPAEFIEQPLVVPIFQPAVPQLIREFSLQRLGFELEVRHLTVSVLVPQRQRILEHGLEPCPALQRSTRLPLHHVAEGA